MKKLLLASAIPALFAATSALAADAPPVTGNMTIATDYRFRGVSQTFMGPTIQGGIDYAHASGLYLGNWNSNVSGLQYPNGSSIEMDFYGGYKKAFGDLTLDVGTLYYYYPGSKFTGLTTSTGGTSSEVIKNWEVYVGGTWKWLSAKYFHSFTNYFGLSEDATVALCNPDVAGCTPLDRSGNTKGTQYLTVAASFEVAPKLTLGISAGLTKVANYSKLDYMDYKVGVTYDLQGWQLGANVVGSDADKKYWYAGPNGEGKVKEVGKPALVLSVAKTF